MNTIIDGDRLPKLRLILIGNTKVGKTAFINQFINNKFISEYYPTSFLTIYRKLYNFNPGENQTDELYYVELLDMMGYDYSKTIKDHNEFVGRILVDEKDISSNAEYNIKIPNSVLNNIHYEYFPEQRTASNMRTNLGLFSKADVMAYLFMFDYADDASLNDMLEMYSKINNAEESKVKSKEKSEERTTVKVFICNKYFYKVQYEASIAEYPTAVKRLMEQDTKTKEIVMKIGRVIDKGKERENNGSKNNNVKVIEKEVHNAKAQVFFTNAQCNSTVRNAMNFILMKIIQKRKLWEGKAFEVGGSVVKKKQIDKNDERKGIGALFSICGAGVHKGYASDDDNDEDDNGDDNGDDNDDDNNNNNNKKEIKKAKINKDKAKGTYEKEDSSDEEIDQPKRFNISSYSNQKQTSKETKDIIRNKDNEDPSNCLIF